MRSVTFRVDAIPPYKQTPADRAEKATQAERRESLQTEAREAMQGTAPLPSRCAVSIRYTRSRGRSDSANIIGGVLDDLQEIVFDNDNQAVEISYAERSGSKDWYQVTVTESVF